MDDQDRLVALTLWQPWATLMAVGAKKVETRGRRTHYRGWVAIHAAAIGHTRALVLCGTEPFATVLREATGLSLHADADEMSNHWEATRLPRGCVVAVAHLFTCRPTEGMGAISDQERAFGDYSPGRYGWFFDRVVRLPEPVPCKGAQGLWMLTPDVEARVRAAASVCV